MLMIRFQRVGRRNDPAYRVVVTERRSKPGSGELEVLGSYHPKTKHTVLAGERILHWISKGAKPSATAHNLLVKRGVIRGKKIPVAKGASALAVLAVGMLWSQHLAPVCLAVALVWMLVLNTSGACGDLWMVYFLLRSPSDVLARDKGDVLEFYTTENRS